MVERSPWCYNCDGVSNDILNGIYVTQVCLVLTVDDVDKKNYLTASNLWSKRQQLYFPSLWWHVCEGFLLTDPRKQVIRQSKGIHFNLFLAGSIISFTFDDITGKSYFSRNTLISIEFSNNHVFFLLDKVSELR